jgi:hypothetical protein
MPENSRKSTRTVIAVGLAGVIATAGLHLLGRLDELQTRLEKLESESRVLSPLVSVMSAHRPGAAIPDAYQAVQATGSPNVTPPGSDSPRAWCPASENRGIEWLELTYEKPVSAAKVEIRASFNPGAILRVLIGGRSGPLQELPMVPGPPLAVQALPISPPLEISRVKLELDTAAVPGWNQIDAVALLDAAGTHHWAASAAASSFWNQAPAAAPDSVE